jgi:hypothetical protein
LGFYAFSKMLKRLSGKAPKRRHIEISLRVGNTARQEASAHKMGKLFLCEPLVGLKPLDLVQILSPAVEIAHAAVLAQLF